MGFGVMAAKTKHQLLKEIQEELKIISQEEMARSFSQVGYRPTLSRSHTSVEGGRPQKLSKRRMSTPYISPLTMIGEEDLISPETGSATLPRHLEQRPKTLQVRGRAMTTGSSLPFTGKEAVRASPPMIKKASFADEVDIKQVTSRVKRSPSPRRSPRAQRITNGRSSPDIERTITPPPRSPLTPRGRAPKLGVLGKLGSSGFYADNEDDDGEAVHPSKVTIQLPGEEITVPNLGAVSAGNSPLQVKRPTTTSTVSNGVGAGQISISNLGAASAGNSPLRVKKQIENNQVTISAEVYENSDFIEETTRSNSLTARVTFSTEDSSNSPLLPSPESRRKTNKRSSKRVRAVSPLLGKEDSMMKSKELRVISEDDSDDMLGSSRDTSPSESRTNKAAKYNHRQRGSLSLDRRTISGSKELSSAYKESSKFVYHSFDDASQC